MALAIDDDGNVVTQKGLMHKWLDECIVELLLRSIFVIHMVVGEFPNICNIIRILYQYVAPLLANYGPFDLVERNGLQTHRCHNGLRIIHEIANTI